MRRRWPDKRFPDSLISGAPRRDVMRTVALLATLGLLLSGCFDGGSEPATGAPRDPSPQMPPDAQLAEAGRWLAPFDGEVPAVNMVLLHTGEVLYWSGVEENGDDPTDVPFLVTPTKPGETRVLVFEDSAPTILMPGLPDGGAADLFCSGQTILPDGRVLTGGGSEFHGGPNPDTPYILDGSHDARIFDPLTRNWTVVSDMLLGRWYPSLFTDADGNGVAASGIASLTDPTEHWPQWEQYDAADDSWSGVDGTDQLLPLYPRVFTVPGGPYKGQVFYNTVGTLWGPFGEHPLEATWNFQYVYDPVADAWTQLGLSTYGVRQHGASVMLQLDPSDGYAPELVTFGGSLWRSFVATAATERNDLSTSPPTNTMAAPMNQARWHLNGVLLPDGDVLAVGGGLYDNVYTIGTENPPVMTAESFDPQTGAWTELAAMSVPRMYHSTALLLPDGRVLAGGHVPLPQEPTNPAQEQIHETRLEIFEPPYLFRGERPSILSAPEEITYGEAFDMDVALNGTLDSVVLVHPGATTHAFDSNQRSVRLKVTAQEDGHLRVVAPPDGHVVPPGHYMVFVNRQHPDGAVPSVAAWVHLD